MPGEGVIVLEHYKDDFVKSSGGIKFFIPAVAVTSRYIKRQRSIKLKKTNLLVRDNSTCQYCNLKLSTKNTTIDHVKPKSHFQTKEDAHTWDNVVIACSRCNTKKANKTLEQSGMKLLKQPREPNSNNFFSFLNFPIPEEWSIYVWD